MSFISIDGPILDSLRGNYIPWWVDTIVCRSQIRCMVRKAILRAFAAEVRHSRSVLGLSQEELADRANLHRNYIGMIERLERAPTLLAMDGIARGLKLKLSELISRAEERAR